MAWHGVGHESAVAVTEHPGGAARADGTRVAALAAKPDGRSNYRNVAWVNAAGARKAGNNPAGCKAGRKNLAESAPSAGPRTAARRQLLPADVAAPVPGNAGFAVAGVPCRACYCGSSVPRANAANGVLPADSERCNTEPGDSGVGTSAHSPSAGTGDSHKDGVGKADVLDLDSRVVETDVGPRELDPERSSLGGEVLTSLRGVLCRSRSGSGEGSLR